MFLAGTKIFSVLTLLVGVTNAFIREQGHEGNRQARLRTVSANAREGGGVASTEPSSNEALDWMNYHLGEGHHQAQNERYQDARTTDAPTMPSWMNFHLGQEAPGRSEWESAYYGQQNVQGVDQQQQARSRDRQLMPPPPSPRRRRGREGNSVFGRRPRRGTGSRQTTPPLEESEGEEETANPHFTAQTPDTPRTDLLLEPSSSFGAPLLQQQPDYHNQYNQQQGSYYGDHSMFY